MEDQSPKPIRCKGTGIIAHPLLIIPLIIYCSISNHRRRTSPAAAVCRAAGEPLVVEEIVVDPPKAYEIRIKIVCTSLCHSDITFWRGKASTPILVAALKSSAVTGSFNQGVP